MNNPSEQAAALRELLAAGVQQVRSSDGAGVTYMTAGDMLRALGHLEARAASGAAGLSHVHPQFSRGM
jgi:hypothetical protein